MVNYLKSHLLLKRDNDEKFQDHFQEIERFFFIFKNSTFFFTKFQGIDENFQENIRLLFYNY